MNNQLSVIEQNVLCVLPQSKELASHHNAISMDAEKNYAIQQLYKNDMAIKTAQQNPVSVQNAVLNLSSIGISLNPALKHAYLVPRDGAICLDVSYMGLLHLAQEIGSILWGQARIVYSNDTYENQGLTKEPLHKFKSFGDRGQKVGVYCTVKLPNGDFLTEEMSAEDVLKVRETSKSKNSQYSPWNTFEDEMWRKSVVKRASKYWPKSNGDKGNRFDTAVKVINEHEGLEDENQQHVDKLMELYHENGNPLVLWGFMQQWDHESITCQYIYKNIPKGFKGKVSDKLVEGRKLFFLYKDIFETGSDSEIEECKAELSELELKIINKEIKKMNTLQ